MMFTILDLKKGEKAEIVRLLPSDLEIKFLEMGFLPGNEVKLLQKTAFNATFNVEILGYSIALRKTEASLIEIKKC